MSRDPDTRTDPDPQTLPEDPPWHRLQQEARALAREEPVLASTLHATVIGHRTLEAALAHRLAAKLASDELPAITLRELFADVLAGDAEVRAALRHDLAAAVERDPAAHGIANPFLNHKGYHALQAHRIAHALWRAGRRALALHLQSRVSEVFAVDIHPAARIGSGVFIDHATGVVIGETAVVGNAVSMLQGVTLGGTGKETGDRHPKIGHGVLLSAGATVLGNIRIGDGSKVGAGSVVLADVPPHSTVVGVPGRIVGTPGDDAPGLSMDQRV